MTKSNIRREYCFSYVFFFDSIAKLGMANTDWHIRMSLSKINIWFAINSNQSNWILFSQVDDKKYSQSIYCVFVDLFFPHFCSNAKEHFNGKRYQQWIHQNNFERHDQGIFVENFMFQHLMICLCGLFCSYKKPKSN